MAAMIYLQSPQGDEIKEVEATAEKLSPLMSAGWHQVGDPCTGGSASPDASNRSPVAPS